MSFDAPTTITAPIIFIKFCHFFLRCQTRYNWKRVNDLFQYSVLYKYGICNHEFISVHQVCLHALPSSFIPENRMLFLTIFSR